MADHPDSEFISEPISVSEFDTSAMKSGLAGSPKAFTWRGEERTVVELVERRKFSRGDAHNPAKEKYLKREYFHVILDDGWHAELYIERQPRTGASAKGRKQRWFLYTRWREDEATFHGRYYTVDGAINQPKPIQTPTPPLWIAGGGEQLTLVDGSGLLVVDFRYDDQLPWPTAADGQGSTLELISPARTPIR